PIEIAGLSGAWKPYTSEKQYCAIGSVKSNIGHLEAAAGISQVAKVVLQMKHKKLVPSLLHTARLNPHIDFENTPFFVQQSLQEWKQPVLQVNGEEVVYPRRAGVSSFGAGGVNVHLILEEYRAKDHEDMQEEFVNQPVVIVLSAQNEQNLKKSAQLLKAYVEKDMQEPRTTINLRDMAYTLQTGRNPMSCRLAFTARDLEEILEKLSLFLDAGEMCGENGLYVGYKTAEKKLGTDVALDDLQTVQSSAVTSEKRAELWASGKEIDWESVYQNEKRFKVPLPTYPFSKERYWVGRPQGDASTEDAPLEPATDAVGTESNRDQPETNSDRTNPTLNRPTVRMEENSKRGEPENRAFLAELYQAFSGERQTMMEKY
ncbi:MAG: type I polyketide synthase, partial [Chloroflexi bacterium]